MPRLSHERDSKLRSVAVVVACIAPEHIEVVGECPQVLIWGRGAAKASRPSLASWQ